MSCWTVETISQGLLLRLKINSPIGYLVAIWRLVLHENYQFKLCAKFKALALNWATFLMESSPRENNESSNQQPVPINEISRQWRPPKCCANQMSRFFSLVNREIWLRSQWELTLTAFMICKSKDEPVERAKSNRLLLGRFPGNLSRRVGRRKPADNVHSDDTATTTNKLPPLKRW